MLQKIVFCQHITNPISFLDVNLIKFQILPQTFLICVLTNKLPNPLLIVFQIYALSSEDVTKVPHSRKSSKKLPLHTWFRTFSWRMCIISDNIHSSQLHSIRGVLDYTQFRKRSRAKVCLCLASLHFYHHHHHLECG